MASVEPIVKSETIQYAINNMERHERSLIYGYNREFEKENKTLIPKDIIHLIAVYYLEFEQWDLNLKSMDIKLSFNDRCVHHDRALWLDGNQTAWRSIYGKTICKKNKMYKWRFKIIKIDPNSGNGNSWKILIGIMQDKFCKNKLESCFNRRQPCSYGFIGSIASLTGDKNCNDRDGKYGQKFENKGDTLTMILNMKTYVLSYIINGINYGKAYDIDHKGHYRLALSIADGRYVQLL